MSGRNRPSGPEFGLETDSDRSHITDRRIIDGRFIDRSVIGSDIA